MAHVESKAERRHRELTGLLMERHPESSDELCQLSNLTSELIVEAENEAVIDHGEQILSVIEGRTYTGPRNTERSDLELSDEIILLGAGIEEIARRLGCDLPPMPGQGTS